MKKVSKSLQRWFIVHFILDYLFGVPLLLFPSWTLGLFGFLGIELLTARLVGAALLGIGGISLIAHNKSKEVYKTLLTLKLIWSGTAIIAILITIVEGAPVLTWLFLAIFVFFFLLWAYYLHKNN
jgi:hypothetical protein